MHYVCPAPGPPSEIVTGKRGQEVVRRTSPHYQVSIVDNEDGGALEQRPARASSLDYSTGSGLLEGACAVQKVDDVAFVGLQPVEADRWHRAEVEAVDVAGVQ